MTVAKETVLVTRAADNVEIWPLSATPFFAYMLECGYYILFGASRVEENHCDTINDS